MLCAPAIGACNRADGGFKDLQLGDYMTGLRMFDDAYTKSVRIQCGTAIVDAASRTFRIGRRTPGYENILWVHVQDNDRSATLSCADDEVLVGLKLRYRADQNEAAFTYFQPFCSKVSVEQ